MPAPRRASPKGDAQPKKKAGGKKEKKKKDKKKGSKMNAGFFDTSGDDGVLYPNGSNEGYDPENPGHLRDGTGDPMGWLPKGLRQRVSVVDTATTSEQQQRAAMEEYVETGKRVGEPQPEPAQNMEDCLLYTSPSPRD